MSGLRLRSSTAVVALFTLAVLAAAMITVGGASGARARPTSGTAWVTGTHSENGVSIFAGDIEDKVLGRGAIIYRVVASSGPETGTVKVTARRVTVYTPKGSLWGTGSATQTFNPDGTATVTDGHVSLTHGTGALRGRSLVATFSGPYKDTVYTFTYRGTLR